MAIHLWGAVQFCGHKSPLSCARNKAGVAESADYSDTSTIHLLFSDMFHFMCACDVCRPQVVVWVPARVIALTALMRDGS